MLIRYSFIFILLLFLNEQSSYSQNFPGESWEQNQEWDLDGWSDELYSDFQQFIIDSTQITGLVLVQNGKIVYSYGNIEENSYIASCRKSVLAMLYGKYVMDGTIDINKTLSELSIDDVNPLLEIEKQASIKDLISARSGIFLGGSNPGDLRNFAPERGSVKPGEFWLYSNWDFNLAGYLFEKESGKNIYDEIENQFAIPLQMQNWDRSLQQKSGDSTLSLYPAYHMWFSTQDLARLGYLMLNKGKWKNKQIIDKQWVFEMTKESTTTEELKSNVPIFGEDDMDRAYGYMWWLWKNVKDSRLRGSYSALGAWGQTITVYPEVGVVLAVKTNSLYRRRTVGHQLIKVIEKAPSYYNKNLGEIKRKLVAEYNLGEYANARKLFQEFHASHPNIELENYLNRLGYQYMVEGDQKACFAIFKLNVETYPTSWNAYDSLGEIYALIGDAKNAILNYEKSIELNPNNTNAVNRVIRLKEQ